MHAHNARRGCERFRSLPSHRYRAPPTRERELNTLRSTERRQGRGSIARSRARTSELGLKAGGLTPIEAGGAKSGGSGGGGSERPTRRRNLRTLVRGRSTWQPGIAVELRSRRPAAERVRVERAEAGRAALANNSCALPPDVGRALLNTLRNCWSVHTMRPTTSRPHDARQVLA